MVKLCERAKALKASRRWRNVMAAHPRWALARWGGLLHVYGPFDSALDRAEFIARMECLL